MGEFGYFFGYSLFGAFCFGSLIGYIVGRYYSK